MGPFTAIFGPLPVHVNKTAVGITIAQTIPNAKIANIIFLSMFYSILCVTNSQTRSLKLFIVLPGFYCVEVKFSMKISKIIMIRYNYKMTSYGT